MSLKDRYHLPFAEKTIADFLFQLGRHGDCQLHTIFSALCWILLLLLRLLLEQIRFSSTIAQCSDLDSKMSNTEEVTANSEAEVVTASKPAEPPAADVEKQSSGVNSTVSEIVRRRKRHDLMKKVYLVLRGLALLFSLLSFIIMASNNHRYFENLDYSEDLDYSQSFDQYGEYKYLLAVGIVTTVYAIAQVCRHIYEIWTEKKTFESQTFAILDFIGDQVMSYLLISAASTAIPVTNRLRELLDDSFTDFSAASISMAFFAFFTLGLSALVSGYKLSSKSYI